MRSLSADQRTCDGSNPTSAEPRMMLSMVSAKLLAGRAWRTKSARAMGMERLRIGLNCPLDDLPQLLRRHHPRRRRAAVSARVRGDIIRAEGALCGWGISFGDGIGAIVPRRHVGVCGGGTESIPGRG